MVTNVFDGNEVPLISHTVLKMEVAPLSMQYEKSTGLRFHRNSWLPVFMSVPQVAPFSIQHEKSTGLHFHRKSWLPILNERLFNGVGHQ